MKFLPFLPCLLLLFCLGCSTPPAPLTQSETYRFQPGNDTLLNFALDQYGRLLGSHSNTDEIPYAFYPKTGMKWVQPSNWVSGFFPGSLWYLYEYTLDSTLREAAWTWTRMLEDQQFNGGVHDLGFMLNDSYGHAYRFTGDEEAKAILIQAAQTLATRYNPKVGLIRSWDFGEWQYPVIIDGMMNLELLFRATQESGDSTYYNMAVNHARKTLKTAYRPDNSCFHVMDFDTLTGEVISRGTFQGAHDTSAWARGQSWGLYGWTMMFRETGDSLFLQQANTVADFLMQHPRLPEDGIPYWDYDAPNIPDAPRDVSSATILASALVELSSYVSPGRKERYLAHVYKILNALTTPVYKAKLGDNGGLLFYHSVAHLPHDAEVDVGIIYADYYWLETMIRLRRLPDMRPFGAAAPASDMVSNF